MGARSVDTSKSQAVVEKKKLDVQKSADAFEDSLYDMQTKLTKQGLEATLGIGNKQTEIGEVQLNQLKDNTKVLTSFFDSIDTLNEERRNRNTMSLANLDALFRPVNAPVDANFSILQKFLTGGE